MIFLTILWLNKSCTQNGWHGFLIIVIVIIILGWFDFKIYFGFKPENTPIDLIRVMPAKGYNETGKALVFQCFAIFIKYAEFIF
jgi:hypothetical protein